MARPYLIRGAAAVGALALGLQLAKNPSENPETNPNICQYDKATDTLVIADRKTGKLSGIMHDVVEIKDRVVKGPGEILDQGKEIGLNEGIVFEADFNKKACTVKHDKMMSWGEKVTAPMAPNTSFDFKFK
jgi:hypothetical protein